jgi:Uma2 family endonuclease
MGMPATNRRWTVDDVRALPARNGERFECVDGELLVSPGPKLPHQSAVVLLTSALDAYGRRHGIGSAFNGPAELELDDHTLVQPDIFVLPLVDGKRAVSQDTAGAPLLVVEVLSPGTARFDRVIKRARYQRLGVEYWILDLDARVVERWASASARPEIVTQMLHWHPEGADVALTIDLDALVADALGER